MSSGINFITEQRKTLETILEQVSVYGITLAQGRPLFKTGSTPLSKADFCWKTISVRVFRGKVDNLMLEEGKKCSTEDEEKDAISGDSRENDIFFPNVCI